MGYVNVLAAYTWIAWLKNISFCDLTDILFDFEPYFYGDAFGIEGIVINDV